MGSATTSILVVVIAFVVQFALMSHPYETDPHTIGSLARAAVDPKPSSLEGIVAVITGVTSGLGRETTKTLLQQGATVVGVGRNPSSLRRTGDDFASFSGRFVPVVADLSDLSAVAKASESILEQFPAIDYLVNNAGIHYGAPWKSHEIDIASATYGLDKCFVTNYLSHFLLTEKLLPALRKSKVASPRIIQVSSTYHWLSDGLSLATTEGSPVPFAARGDFYDFRHRATAYGNSKLAQVLHALALDRRLSAEGSKVSVTSVCPAWVGTDIAPEGLMRTVVKTFAFSTEQGIYSLLNAMFRPEVKSGDFVGNTDVVTNFPMKSALITSNLKLNLGKTLGVVHMREQFTNGLAMVLMAVQRFDFGWHVQKSSPESYDKELQENLWQWSKATVKEYM